MWVKYRKLRINLPYSTIRKIMTVFHIPSTKTIDRLDRYILHVALMTKRTAKECHLNKQEIRESRLRNDAIKFACQYNYSKPAARKSLVSLASCSTCWDTD